MTQDTTQRPTQDRSQEIEAIRRRLPKPPTVIVYVRHKETCPKREEGEFYPRCDCAKWLRYSRDGKQIRQSADTRSFTVAEEKRKELQARLDGKDTGPEAPTKERLTISQQIALFIENKENEKISPVVIRKYRCELPRFESFMAQRSKFYPEDVTLPDLIKYQTTWNDTYPARITQQKVRERLKAFLRFSLPDTVDKLTRDFKPVKLRNRDRQKPDPFTQEEIEKLLSQIPLEFTPDRTARLKALVHLMIGTGLAIVDATLLRPENLSLHKKNGVEYGWLEIERQKTGRIAQQKVSAGLVHELLAVKNGNPDYIFFSGDAQKESVTGNFQRDLRHLMKVTGTYTKGNLSHRFRDTFVDTCFGYGWSLTEVAAALGDTEAVVERHYKSLTSRLRDRLESLPVRSW